MPKTMATWVKKDKEQQDEDMAFGIFLGVRAVTNKAELREKKQEGGDDAKGHRPRPR